MLSVLVLSMVILCVIYVIGQMNFPNQAEEMCEEIGLELFDYSSGSIFIESSITCINPTTKEIVKIR